MSKTRGINSPARQDQDYYRTPAWTVERLLDRVESEIDIDGVVLDPGCGDGAIAEVLHSRGFMVLGVEKNERLAQRAMTRFAGAGGVVVDQADILDERACPTAPYVAVVGNPPYRLAAEFIGKALQLVEEGGLVAMLLRQGFGGSCNSRRWLFDPFTRFPDGRPGIIPELEIRLPDRPSFVALTSCKACGGRWRWPAEVPTSTALHPTGRCALGGEPPRSNSKYTITRTDAADYAWTIWRRGYQGETRTVWAWS